MVTDYSSLHNWARYDYNNPEKADTKVDVLFINGTVLKNPDQDNGIALISDRMRTAFSKGFSGNADVFDDGVRMYVPCYRQIALNYMLPRAESHRSLLDMMRNSEAAEDISTFLDHYFRNCNDGRPFILAGISQGGTAVQLALETYFGEREHRKYLSNLIAAYSIAYGVDREWLSQFDYLKYAEGAADTGVLLSWVTEGIGCEARDFLVPDNPENSLIINPINWRTDDTYAAADENPGTFVKGKIMTPGLYNLQYSPERGCLICDNNTCYLPGGMFGGKSLHMQEITLAYGSIRKNMHDRINSFFSNV